MAKNNKNTKVDEKSTTKTEEITVTKKEKDAFLTGLVTNNRATKTVTIIKGKLDVVFSSLSASDQLEVEQVVSTMKTSAQHTLHKYALMLLAKGLDSYGDVDMSTLSDEEVTTFIEDLPAPIIDKLVKEQHYFNKQVQAVIDPEAIEETFFAQASDS
tara:strand:+ start:234 stop:704 length:471 start_codon:yes stop_codon:yes gene_type:complete